MTLPQDSSEGAAAPRPPRTPRTGRSAALVAIGILCSRLMGLIRQRYFSKYFGQQTEAADAFNQAFRIPNLLQNLFGEGALSASFVPVYVATLTRGDKREAARLPTLGHLPGEIMVLEPMLVAELSRSGATIETRFPLHSIRCTSFG